MNPCFLKQSMFLMHLEKNKGCSPTGWISQINVSSETLRHLTANPCRLAPSALVPAMPPRGRLRSLVRRSHLGAQACAGWRLRMTGRKILQERSILMCCRTKRMSLIRRKPFITRDAAFPQNLYD